MSRLSRATAALAATLLIFAILHGLTDTLPFDLSYPLWLMAMLSILLASKTPPTATLIQ